ncbi:phage major capsid protein [Bradyrhizobium yuanmingense]|uniref:phage major capsid protein n=1 Tax=Bradyrhizobium yuanmingense TaxID=108015 RepID=UPI0023B8A663|nr:phage major capsid protein [Bradyrhizobium yuanmingense]MDF0521586.1 phage major capsid protein [Bradyrhizobium yuanmingense]
MLLKAATSPATTSSSTWAGSLASAAVADFISVMGGASAAATVFGSGHQFTFDHTNGIAMPGVVADANIAGFVGEAAPIPVKGLSFDGPRLERRKFATIVPFTREIFEHSTPNIEAIVRTVLTESLGLATDAALFSDSAGSAIRPPGLLLGIAPLTPSTATNPQDAMVADITVLVSAVAPIGEAVLVAATDQAVALRLRQHRETYTVLPSAALAAGTVIAIAPNGLASAIDAVPRFELASEATLVMDDAAGPISTVGTPNVVAAPARSLFQSDTIALRVILQVSWGLRSPLAISFLTGASW